VALLAFAAMAKQLEAARWPPEEEIHQQCDDDDVSQEDDIVVVGGYKPRIIVVVIFVDPVNISIDAEHDLCRIGHGT
jgi:hypothetical protein